MHTIAATRPLHAVFVRCDEPIGRVLHAIQFVGSRGDFTFTIYQKQTARCNQHPLPGSLPGSAALRIMPLNLGRECAGYLQFLHDEYYNLPAMTAFLQWGAEVHMPLPLHTSLGALRNTSGGFFALSKNSFEGRWPTPCEPADQARALGSCAEHYWRMAANGTRRDPSAPPERFRFYANGLFAVARERVLAHPRALYRLLLDRMQGRAPLACVGGVHRPFASWKNASNLVRAEADCLMLEKMWHIYFGEEPTLAPPTEYNAWRFPPEYLSMHAKGRTVRAGRIECPITAQK